MVSVCMSKLARSGGSVTSTSTPSLRAEKASTGVGAAGGVDAEPSLFTIKVREALSGSCGISDASLFPAGAVTGLVSNAAAADSGKSSPTVEVTLIKVVSTSVKPES